jgi:hypothetical protein
MADAYTKMGRGGAGNFYSKKGVEDVKGKGKAVVYTPFSFSSYLNLIDSSATFPLGEALFAFASVSIDALSHRKHTLSSPFPHELLS